MRLAFALYKYFPYGGLARDFVRVAKLCLAKGHRVDVYVMDWQGEIPNGVNVHLIKIKGWTNHARVASFHRQLASTLVNSEFGKAASYIHKDHPGLEVVEANDLEIKDSKEKSYSRRQEN